MSREHNGDSPAYPWGEHGTALGGLTKREAFAMAAMQGVLANPARCTPEARSMISAKEMASLVGKVSVEFADALLAELAKGGTP